MKLLIPIVFAAFAASCVASAGTCSIVLCLPAQTRAVRNAKNHALVAEFKPEVSIDGSAIVVPVVPLHEGLAVAGICELKVQTQKGTSCEVYSPVSDPASVSEVHIPHRLILRLPVSETFFATVPCPGVYHVHLEMDLQDLQGNMKHYSSNAISVSVK